MPIFEYICEKCGNKFEKLVRGSDSEKKQECPKCGSEDTKKAISAFSCSGSDSGHSCGG